MNWLMSIFASPAPVAPVTVDGAIANLSVSLENLAAVSVDRRAHAAAMHIQADTLKAVAVDAEAEADRADRIHGNIAALLK